MQDRATPHITVLALLTAWAQFYHEWQIAKTVSTKKPRVFRVRVTLFSNWCSSQCFHLKAVIG